MYAIMENGYEMERLGMLYFGTAESFGIDLGFWIALFLIMIIVILVNLVCWTMTPKRRK